MMRLAYSWRVDVEGLLVTAVAGSSKSGAKELTSLLSISLWESGWMVMR